MKKVMCLWYGYIIAKYLEKCKIIFVRKYQILHLLFMQLVYSRNPPQTETAHLKWAVSVFCVVKRRENEKS